MNTKLLLGFLCFFICASAFSQVRTENIKDGITRSKLHYLPKTVVPTNHLIDIPIDLARLQKEDEVNKKLDVPYRFGVSAKTNFSLENSGTWRPTAGGKVWQIQLTSPNAFSLNFQFDNFELADGAELILYNAERTMQIGPITSAQNNENKIFATDLLQGASVVVELFEPMSARTSSKLNISKVVHGYKNQFLLAPGYGASGACQNDVACYYPSPDNWELSSKSVGMVLLGDGTRWCSGALLNTNCQNLSPRFLTANHCLDGQTPGGFVIRFGYKRNTCPGSGDDLVYSSYFGTSVLSTWFDSDFALLQLNSGNPITGADIAYAGWDRTTSNPTKVALIHHPMGDLMKISFNTSGSTVFSTQLQIGGQGPIWPANSHSVANFSTGSAEAGSSGGPFFDQNKRVVGQLNGGYSSCSNPTQPENYGRLSVSWAGGGSSNNRLSDWLTNNSAVTQTNTIQSPYINGPDLICTTGSFSVSSPIGAVTWSTSNSGLLTINSAGLATRVGSFSGDVTVNATMTLASGCGTTVIKKTVHVGTPSFSGAGQYQFDACTYQAYISPQSGANPTWSVVSGSVGLGSTTGYSVYASSTTGGVIAVTINNACGSSTMEFTIPGCEGMFSVYPNPAKDNITLAFKEIENEESLPSKIVFYKEGSDNPYKVTKLDEALGEGLSKVRRNVTFDVSMLPRGIYYLHIFSANGDKILEKTRILLE